MTKQFTAQPSRTQVARMRDLTLADASPQESYGPDFWREAVPLYPSRNRRLARVRLDPEVLAWFAQRRGFIRNTVGAGTCDLVAGIPHDLEALETTRPYYRSTHVFVTRARDGLTIRSMDDPRLARLRIGVHVVGDDYASPPPLQALGRRGLVRNVSGYSLYGNYAEPDPPARLVEAVAQERVDVAIVWGPLGGYFAPRQEVPLQVTEIARDTDGAGLSFAYDIAKGVRKGDRRLRDALQAVLDRHQGEVEAILRAYHVPLKPLAMARGGA